MFFVLLAFKFSEYLINSFSTSLLPRATSVLSGLFRDAGNCHHHGSEREGDDNEEEGSGAGSWLEGPTHMISLLEFCHNAHDVNTSKDSHVASGNWRLLYFNTCADDGMHKLVRMILCIIKWHNTRIHFLCHHPKRG